LSIGGSAAADCGRRELYITRRHSITICASADTGMKLDCKTLFILFRAFEQCSAGKSDFFTRHRFLNYV
jgi:hypothetical protein